MSKQAEIGNFFWPVTLSNERDAPNVTVNKNVTPKITCNTDIPSSSTTTTEPSSYSATPLSLEKSCQPDQKFTFPETYFGKAFISVALV